MLILTCHFYEGRLINNYQAFRWCRIAGQKYQADIPDSYFFALSLDEYQNVRLRLVDTSYTASLRCGECPGLLQGSPAGTQSVHQGYSTSAVSCTDPLAIQEHVPAPQGVTNRGISRLLPEMKEQGCQ